MGEYVRLEVDDGVGQVRLDRPPANAIDHQLGLELQDAFREAARRDDVGAVVIWGGPKIFAAGADIKEMAGFGPEEIRPVVAALGDALDLLEAMPKISIAAINGYALGGGFELALAADLRYLADDGKVGQPEIGIGVIPGAGGTQRLTHLVGPGRARDLVYTGPAGGRRRGVGSGARGTGPAAGRRPGRRHGRRARVRSGPPGSARRSEDGDPRRPPDAGARGAGAGGGAVPRPVRHP